MSIRERALGEDHPSVADSHQGLARTLINQERNGEAQREVRRALALRERAFGPDHRLVAECRFVLGYLLHLDGQHVAAEDELARALVTHEKTLPRATSSTTRSSTPSRR